MDQQSDLGESRGAQWPRRIRIGLAITIVLVPIVGMAFGGLGASVVMSAPFLAIYVLQVRTSPGSLLSGVLLLCLVAWTEMYAAERVTSSTVGVVFLFIPLGAIPILQITLFLEAMLRPSTERKRTQRAFWTATGLFATWAFIGVMAGPSYLPGVAIMGACMIMLGVQSARQAKTQGRSDAAIDT